MKRLKPKDIAQKLQLHPSKVSVLAKEIENSNIHVFPRTPLGSYQFQTSDYQVLKEYQQLIGFFKKRKPALTMLKIQMEMGEEKKERPNWSKFMRNAVFR